MVWQGIIYGLWIYLKGALQIAFSDLCDKSLCRKEWNYEMDVISGILMYTHHL